MENDLRRAAIALREFALGLPGAYEEFPWEEHVVHDRNPPQSTGL